MSSRLQPFREAFNSRDLAYLVFLEAARTGEFATQLLEKALEASRHDETDRRFTAELVNGVIRRQGTLDALLQPLLQRPLPELEEGLRWVLRMGAYQLVLLSGVAPHAAVHETVETAKRCGEPRWAGFVNGVLRTLSRMVTGDVVSTPAADAVPLANGSYRRLNSPLLPNPTTNFASYFATAFGFPTWLVERWNQRFDSDHLTRMGFWFNGPQALWLRVNTTQTSRDAYLSELQAAGVAAEAGSLPESIRLESRVRVESLPGFAEGRFSVQDESAMGAAIVVDPRPGESILDLCAAPGGKTTHLAERMRNSGRLIAVDVDRQRVQMISENAWRLKLSIVEAEVIPRDLSDVPPGPFDAVLVDVPCSNTGVLGKRPEARWRLQPSELNELTALQRLLLTTALGRAKDKGRVVYSTCSIEPEENTGVVAAVLAERPEWRLEKDVVHLPGAPADGAYQALLVRSS